MVDCSQPVALTWCAYQAGGERAPRSWLPRQRANLVWICPAPLGQRTSSQRRTKKARAEATVAFWFGVDGPTAVDAGLARSYPGVPCEKVV